MEFSKKVTWQTHTSGDGYWSSASKGVRIVKVEVEAEDDDDYGELLAYFSPKDWDCNTLGLIYTDPLWLDEFRAMMRTLGFTSKACDDISYSEQGMQGINFVSMDVGPAFLRELEPMYRFTINRQPVNI